MAFSTIQGSGGAPDSFVGTSGVDSIVVVNSEGNYFLGAQQAGDNITFQTTDNVLYNGVVSNATIKGGQGTDTLTWNTAGGASTFYSSAFVNGNSDRDTITTDADDTFLTSTIHGGAANDTVNITSALTSSLVNGNKGVDTIAVTGTVTASTIYGGGGNDVIDFDNNAGSVTNSVISGDLGNDIITAETGGGESANGSSIFGGQGVDTITASLFGDDADDEIFINGNEGDDTIELLNAVASAQVFGGSGDDTLDAGGATGSMTMTGGSGADTIELGNGAGAGNSLDVVNYTAVGQGGAAGSATSVADFADGDVITVFNDADDVFNFAADSLVGVRAAAAVGSINGWNLNNAGVFISDELDAATATYADLAAQIGTVTGDAGDTGYYFFETVNDDAYAIVQLTLGTDKAGDALNAGDQVALLGTVDTNDLLTAANISFVG